MALQTKAWQGIHGPEMLELLERQLPLFEHGITAPEFQRFYEALSLFSLIDDNHSGTVEKWEMDKFVVNQKGMGPDMAKFDFEETWKSLIFYGEETDHVSDNGTVDLGEFARWYTYK